MPPVVMEQAFTVSIFFRNICLNACCNRRLNHFCDCFFLNIETQQMFKSTLHLVGNFEKRQNRHWRSKGLITNTV